MPTPKLPIGCGMARAKKNRSAAQKRALLLSVDLASGPDHALQIVGEVHDGRVRVTEIRRAPKPLAGHPVKEVRRAC